MTADEQWVADRLAVLSKDPRYAGVLTPDGRPRNPAAASRPDRIRRTLPCVHEESVREFCHTCRGEKAEGRHVRGCAIYEVCTRENNSSQIVKSCAACDEYSAGGESLPPAH